MKSKFLISLMLASAIGSGFASTSVSTLSQREDMIKEAFAKGNPEDALKAINEAQQEGKIKTDDSSYIVVIKKEGDGKYIRVAHYRKDKLNQSVEQSIINVMHEAETKLAGASGPVAFSFATGEKRQFAVLSKHGDYLVFDICPTQEEADNILKETKPAEVKSEEVKPVTEEVAKEAEKSVIAPIGETKAAVAAG